MFTIHRVYDSVDISVRFRRRLSVANNIPLKGHCMQDFFYLSNKNNKQ